MVVCVEAGKKERYYDCPLVLIEVSSPGTQYLDRAKKKQDYLQLPLLSLYLIIDSTRNHVTAIYRKSGNSWEEFAFTNERTIHLPVISGLPAIAFTAAQLYEKTAVAEKLIGCGER
jgi:Uma2 family endonuclease